MAVLIKTVLEGGKGIENITLGGHEYKYVSTRLHTEGLHSLAGLVDIGGRFVVLAFI